MTNEVSKEVSKEECLAIIDSLIDVLSLAADEVKEHHDEEIHILVVTSGDRVTAYGPLQIYADKIREIAELLHPRSKCTLLPLYGKRAYTEHVLARAHVMRDILADILAKEEQ